MPRCWHGPCKFTDEEDAALWNREKLMTKRIKNIALSKKRIRSVADKELAAVQGGLVGPNDLQKLVGPNDLHFLVGPNDRIR